MSIPFVFVRQLALSGFTLATWPPLLLYGVLGVWSSLSYWFNLVRWTTTHAAYAATLMASRSLNLNASATVFFFDFSMRSTTLAKKFAFSPMWSAISE